MQVNERFEYPVRDCIQRRKYKKKYLTAVAHYPSREWNMHLLLSNFTLVMEKSKQLLQSDPDAYFRSCEANYEGPDLEKQYRKKIRRQPARSYTRKAWVPVGEYC